MWTEYLIGEWNLPFLCEKSCSHQRKISMAVTRFAPQASEEFLKKMLFFASIRPELEQVLIFKLTKQMVSMTSLLWTMMSFAKRQSQFAKFIVIVHHLLAKFDAVTASTKLTHGPSNPLS
jgi:hypothetical protein